jgi:YHS domain-containing protein
VPEIVDPVCGKPVDPLRARAIGIFGGTTYYFCSADCKARFADPRRTERAPVAAPTPATPPKPAPPPKLVAPSKPVAAPVATAPVVAEDPADEPPPQKSSGGGAWWALAIVPIGAGVWFFMNSATTNSTPAPKPAPVANAPKEPSAPSPPPVATPAPVPAPAPAIEKTPRDTPPSSSTVDSTQPLRLGLRWFVTDRPDSAELVERLLVIDGAEHAKLYDIGHVALHANVATRDGSASLAVKEPFSSSTAETGVIYEDNFTAGEVGLDVRVERTEEGIVASQRPRGGTAWKKTLTLPLAADAKVRGAAFKKSRYDEAAAP